MLNKREYLDPKEIITDPTDPDPAHRFKRKISDLKRSLPVLLKLTDKDLTASSISVFCGLVSTGRGSSLTSASSRPVSDAMDNRTIITTQQGQMDGCSGQIKVTLK